MVEWSRSIAELVNLQAQIAEHDTDGIFPVTKPAPGAARTRIAVCEQEAGLVLDEQHRSFLAEANGWPGFFETQDLLSTEQLVGGHHRDTFDRWIESAPGAARAAGFTAEGMLPVAVDLVMPLFAAMPVREGRVLPRVFSLDPSGVIDDFASFELFVAATIAYTERNLADVLAGRYRVTE